MNRGATKNIQLLKRKSLERFNVSAFNGLPQNNHTKGMDKFMSGMGKTIREKLSSAGGANERGCGSLYRLVLRVRATVVNVST